MIQKNISIIPDVTLSEEFTCDVDISGVNFTLSSNHGERNFEPSQVEVYDDDKGWIPNISPSATEGRIRIHVPARLVRNYFHLNKCRYSIKATYQDGSVAIVANGNILTVEPEDAEPANVTEFKFSGFSNNIELKLKRLAEAVFTSLNKEPERKYGDYDSSQIKHGSGKLSEFLNAIPSNTTKIIDKKLIDIKSMIKSVDEVAETGKEKANNAIISINNLSDSISKFKSHIESFIDKSNGALVFNQGSSVIRMRNNGDIELNTVTIDKDGIKCNAGSFTKLNVNGKDAGAVFAQKNGNINDDFECDTLKANKIIVDGINVSDIKRHGLDIIKLMKRLKQAEEKIENLERLNRE